MRFKYKLRQCLHCGYVYGGQATECAKCGEKQLQIEGGKVVRGFKRVFSTKRDHEAAKLLGILSQIEIDEHPDPVLKSYLFETKKQIEAEVSKGVKARKDAKKERAKEIDEQNMSGRYLRGVPSHSRAEEEEPQLVLIDPSRQSEEGNLKGRPASYKAEIAKDTPKWRERVSGALSGEWELRQEDSQFVYLPMSEEEA